MISWEGIGKDGSLQSRVIETYKYAGCLVGKGRKNSVRYILLAGNKKKPWVKNQCKQGEWESQGEMKSGKTPWKRTRQCWSI